MKSTMRFQAATCSGLYMPVQPGLIRPSRLTSVISVITSPAPPIARLPRWTRCQSFGVPSSAEYWHIGEQTTRLVSTSSRSRKGVNIGGGAGVAGTVTRLCASALDANQRSTDSTNFGSRTFRFRSEEHTSELQSRLHLVCRLLLEKKNDLASTYNTSRVLYPILHFLMGLDPIRFLAL